MALVLAATIAVRGLALLIGLKEQHLRDTLVGVNSGRQRRCIRELESNVPLPLGFKRCHVNDDAATRVGRLSQANGQHVAWNAKILDRACERERVRRNNAGFTVDVDETAGVEGLRVNNGRIDVGENLELGGTANIVAIARGSVGNDRPSVVRANLPRLERFDHAVLLGHAPDPAVRFDTHQPASITIFGNLLL